MKRPTSTTYTGPSSGAFGSTVSLSATLRDTTGGGTAALAGKPLTLTIGSQSCTTPNTNAAGSASCNITLNQAAGSYTVLSSFAGDATYAGSSDSDPFTIGLATTTIVYDGATSGFTLNPANMAATLTSGGSPLSGKPVTLTFAGGTSCTATTDGSGHAACAVTPAQPAGTYSVSAFFPGDGSYAVATSAPATYTLIRRPTTTTYTGPAAGDAGDSVTFSATLRDVTAGGPGVALAGKALTFTLGLQSCTTGLTNASGSASCSFVLNQSVGSHVVVSSFAGDGFYSASTHSTPFIVTADATVIVYDGQLSGFVLNPFTLAATLTDADNNAPIGGASVTLTFNSTSCSATTNAAGRATCTITPAETAGSYPVSAAFAGDGVHAPATSTTTATLNARPTAVTYSGPASGAVGASVTMSGDLVDLSGLPVPLSGEAVSFTIGTQSCSGTTNAAGHATCVLTLTQTAGSYSVATAFGGVPGVYTASSDSDPFTIVKGTPTITYDGDTSAYYAEAPTYAATLLGANGTPIVGATVRFEFGGFPGTELCTATTTATGRATCAGNPAVEFYPAGQTVFAMFAGNASYNGASDTEAFTWLRRPTALTYEGDLAGDFGDSASMVAHLVDVRSGHGIQSWTVEFTLGSQACDSSTGGDARARCAIVLNQTPGTYPLVASFGGSPKYVESSDTEQFTITAEDVVLTYNGDTEAFLLDPVTLAATLTDSDSPQGIAGQLVSFTFDGASACTDTTDAAGHASCGYTPTAGAGNHTVLASFGGSPVYNADSDSAVLLLKKRPTALAYNGATSGDFSDSVTLSATLTDVPSGGSAVAGKSVVFTLGTQACVGTTNGSGKASCSLTLNQSAGSKSLTAAFAGDAIYLASNASGTFVINVETAGLTYDGDVSAYLLEPVTLSGTLIDGDSGDPIVGETVTFSIAATDTCSGTTNASGHATCSLTPTLPAGPHTVASTFAGNGSFAPASDSDTITLLKRPTVINYDGDTSGDFSDAVTLSATLADIRSGGPLAGKPVTLTLGSQSCTATTNIASQASCSITLNQPAGVYTVSASFAGDAVYVASTDSTPFEIRHEAAVLSYDGDTSAFLAEPVTLSATLTDSDSLAPVVGRPVVFTVGGSAACSGTTDGAGKAACVYTPSTGPGAGPWAIVASFAGDGFYSATSDSATLNLVLRPTDLVYDGDTATQFGDVTVLAATLTDRRTGLPLSGQPVSFDSAGGSCTATTDASGRGVCVVVWSEQAGSYAVDANFVPPSGSIHAASSASSTIVATADDVSIVYDGDTSAFLRARDPVGHRDRDRLR